MWSIYRAMEGRKMNKCGRFNIAFTLTMSMSTTITYVRFDLTEWMHTFFLSTYVAPIQHENVCEKKAYQVTYDSSQLRLDFVLFLFCLKAHCMTN